MDGKKYTALLRKTCVSNLPVDAIKEYGERFVITISPDNPCELIMMNEMRWVEFAENLYGFLHATKNEEMFRKIFAYATEYNLNATGASAQIGMLTTMIGNVGERVSVYYDDIKDYWVIKNSSK